MFSIQLNKHNALESTSDINDLFSSKKIMINDLNPPDDDHCIIYSSLLQLMIVMLIMLQSPLVCDHYAIVFL
jgi:hypothetical protein